MSISWLSAHIFYAEEPEPMLVNSVKPLMQRSIDEGLISRFFFIRYPEGGQHIRLRLEGEQETLEKTKPLLEAVIGKWFESHPSQRTPEWQEIKDLFPNDSVQYITYVAELARYGGKHGLAISHDQFQQSSQAVLELMADSESWDYQRALACAIQMHLALMCALGWNLEQVKTFCDVIATAWLPMAWRWDPNKGDDHEENKRETLVSFAAAYTQQRETLESFFKAYWQALNADVDFDAPWLNRWLAGMRDMGNRLEQTQAEGNLKIPGRHQNAPTLPAYWPILESYVHMTNNRLGILNRDEAFLGYLIKRAVCEI